MALERSKVLPAGFYWVDVFGEKRTGFDQWARDNAALVKQRKTVSHQEETRDWHLFEVLFPVVWLPATEYGFPTKATATTEEGDTVQRPDPEKDPIDKIGDSLNATTVLEGVKAFSWLGALALGIWGLSKLRK